MRSKILPALIFCLVLVRTAFAASPSITSFSPARGPVGTLITVKGANLGSPTAFSIGGLAAIVVSNTGTSLVALVMPGAVTGVISITTSGGTAASTNKFTVSPTPYPYVQQGAPLIGTGGVGQPYQGNSVAISADDNTIAVGGYNDNSNQGAVWFYTRSNGTWTQQGDKLIGAGATGGFGAYFGSSVSLSADGNTVAIGGPDDNRGTGAIWVYTRSAGVWTQQGSKLVGTGAIANNGNPEGNAQQGQAVSLSADGNTLLEGGWFDNGGVGAAWIFTRAGGAWTQLGSKIVGAGIVGNAYFGKSVALSADGNTAAIGGAGNNAVWFYSQSGGIWDQSAELTGSGGFGLPVALNADGSIAIIGATGDNAPLGAAWIYTRSGNAWPQANGTKLVGTGGSNVGYGSTEGSAVALSADGNTAVIGGNTDGSNAGAMWVFTRSGGAWTQQGNKFNGSGSGFTSQGQQGSSAALSADGTTLIEGAPETNTNYGLAAIFTPILPGVTTEAATNISEAGVNLNGLASANGIAANVSFEYGTSPTLTGSTTTTTFISGSNPLAANASNVTFASNIVGLAPSTTYYFRIAATDVDGATNGSILSFTTSAGTSDAYLSNLQISSGTLNPAFNASTTNYSANVSQATTSITITPTTSDPAATVTVNNIAVASGTASGAIALDPGANYFTVKVTAQNGVTTDSYSITITRGASSVATLSLLQPSRGTLSPAFSSTTTSYTASVVNGVTSLTITPTATNSGATIKVNGTAVASGSASQNLPLVVGANNIPIKVTAQDGVTTKTYTVVVTRGPSANCYLSNLKPSAGSLSPAFSASNTTYTTAVVNGAATITITPFTAVPTSTVTVNGTAVTSGTASAPIALNVGSNTITTIVTAQDGTTTRTYTLTVTRASSTNANLSAFKISEGTLTPAFSPGTTSYTASVANGVTSMTVTPTAADITATITVDGSPVASGTASGAIALAVGSNTITTLVTAQDGTTTKTYTLTVTRASGGIDSFGTGISVTTPTETPKMADDGILVHQAVSPNGDGINDFLQIDNIANYPENKLIIMNRNGQLIYEVSGYDNSSKVFDGHSSKNGQMQLPGTYFYQLDYTVKGVSNHKTGFIVLKY